MSKSSIEDLLAELFEGKKKEPQWHRATLATTHMNGERIIKEGVEVGTPYFVDLSTKADAIAINKDRRTSKVVEAAEAVHADDTSHCQIYPLELLTIGAPVVQLDCASCGIKFFVDIGRDHELLAERQLPLPGKEEKDATCDGCWEILRPLMGNRELQSIVKWHADHMKQCRACQRMIPCLEAVNVMGPGDEIVLEDGTPLKDVLSKLEERREPFIRRKLHRLMARDLHRMLGGRGPLDFLSSIGGA